MRVFPYSAVIAAVTMSMVPPAAQARSSHQNYEGQCQTVYLVARLSAGRNQFGSATLEETLKEQASPSVLHTEAQRAVYERIIRDAYSRPVMLEGNSMPTELYREVIHGFADEWAGSCARGELGIR